MWTPEDVANLISNPIYVGIGQFPPIVPDATWIRAASKAIQEEGAEKFFIRMLANLRQAFPSPRS